ncbi:MAG: hypothetical protein IPK08_13860 [Bacteroidetes bacterium]|nr:hypothetical protein [Bacteroidota bacterium]
MYLIFICNSSQAQWVQTNGPHGGEIVCRQEAEMFLGFELYRDATWWAKLFSSTDSGNTWTPVLDVKFTTFTGIVFHDTSIYVCAMDTGIFISNDDGLNWYNSTSAFFSESYFMMQQFAMINFLHVEMEFI